MIELKQEVDYFKLAQIVQTIEQSSSLSASINAEIVVALNWHSGEYGRSSQSLHETNNIEDMAKYCKNLPDFLHSVDAAKKLFVDALGDLEDPYVYSIVNDFSGLRRARISDALNIRVSSDAINEAAALTACVLKVILALKTKETSDEKYD